MKRYKARFCLVDVGECINSERRNKAEYLINNKEDLLQYAVRTEGVSKNRLESAHELDFKNGLEIAHEMNTNCQRERRNFILYGII